MPFTASFVIPHTLAIYLLAFATSSPKARLELVCPLKIVEESLYQFAPNVMQVAYHHMYRICTI